MKCSHTRAYSVVFIAFSVIAFPYCKKSSSSSNIIITHYEGAISAQAGNMAFQSTTLINATDAQGTMYLAGKQIAGSDSSAIQLNFPDSLNTNTTFTDTTGKSFVIVYYGNGQIYRSGNSKPGCTLVITSFDKNVHTISGSFTGMVYPGGNTALTGLLISDGAYSANYVSAP